MQIFLRTNQWISKHRNTLSCDFSKGNRPIWPENTCWTILITSMCEQVVANVCLNLSWDKCSLGSLSKIISKPCNLQKHGMLCILSVLLHTSVALPRAISHSLGNGNTNVIRNLCFCLRFPVPFHTNTFLHWFWWEYMANWASLTLTFFS